MTDPTPTNPIPRSMQAPPGAETVLDGRRYLYFAGTGYLGLQGHPALVQAACDAVTRFGLHPATSRAGYGTAPPVAEVERRSAELLGCEDACYLTSGYVANFALSAALAGTVDFVLLDAWAHDSLRDAARSLTPLKAPPKTFCHRDLDDLAERLATLPLGTRVLVMTDGIFAVSGHLAPVADYVRVLDARPGTMLLVDDAHALAVLGARGRGSYEEAGVASERVNRPLGEAANGARLFQTATLSKAVGGQGGIIAGARALLETIRGSSGWVRGSGAPATPVAAATVEGLKLALADDALRNGLAARVSQLRGALAALGLDVERSPSPIVGVRLESAERMRSVQRRLLDEGIAIAYTRDYAGAGADGMLRIAVFATHTPEMVDTLVDALGRCL